MRKSTYTMKQMVNHLYKFVKRDKCLRDFQSSKAHGKFETLKEHFRKGIFDRRETWASYVDFLLLSEV